jgi:hypothetical protein
MALGPGPRRQLHPLCSCCKGRGNGIYRPVDYRVIVRQRPKEDGGKRMKGLKHQKEDINTNWLVVCLSEISIVTFSAWLVLPWVIEAVDIAHDILERAFYKKTSRGVETENPSIVFDTSVHTDASNLRKWEREIDATMRPLWHTHTRAHATQQRHQRNIQIWKLMWSMKTSKCYNFLYFGWYKNTASI